jgi:RimJ/RimL family protein N-acetyltransferase
MLKGTRITLRSVRRDDLPLLCEFNNDLEMELTGGGDPPFPQSLERLQAEFDQNAAKGGRDGASFAIEADGKLIGQCGLFGFEFCHGVNNHCELGIGIGDKEYWGKGYGTEAVSLLLDWAFTHRNMNRVFLSTISNNERAIACYKKCGFVIEGRLREHAWNRGAYVDLIYMGILKSDWERSTG